MSAPTTSSRHYDEQRQFAVFAARRVGRMWNTVGDDFDADWTPRLSAASRTVSLAQTAAVLTSAAYTPALLTETAQTALPVGELDTTAFSGVNKYGDATSDVLAGATTVAKRAIADGHPPDSARRVAGNWVTSTILTMVADAGRALISADIAQRPQLGGYIRVLNGPSCPRCIFLAGKWFRWNQGFQRHPRCDCRHVPSTSEAWAKAEGFGTDPYDEFFKLSEADQDRLFGANDARAIREGADIYRVTNIRMRGLASTAGGRGWQARRYGTPSRMTIDDILTAAGDDRKAAVRMMLDEGYITGPQVGGGNIKGRYYEGYAGTMGRGGTRRGATTAFQAAQRSGVRDPYAPAGISLDSATQTAAERRLHTAYLNQRAVDEGRNPFSVRLITATERWTVRQEYQRVVDDLDNQPSQVRQLAALLGMI